MKRGFLICALFVLIAAGAYCGWRYYQAEILPEQQLTEADEQQGKLFDAIRPEIRTPEESSQQAADGAPSAPEEPLAAAEAVNSGTVGWLTVPGTHVDYPVCQGTDNDFYLHNGFDGQPNYELGCPFLDYRCEGDFSGFNSIIYAHHITKQRMFADIAKYKDEAYLRAHPTGSLLLRDGAHEIRFFAYLTVPSTAPAYHAVFLTESERQDYLDYLFAEAVWSTADPAEIHTDMHLILLSTCTFEFDEARGVLVGILL